MMTVTELAAAIAKNGDELTTNALLDLLERRCESVVVCVLCRETPDRTVLMHRITGSASETTLCFDALSMVFDKQQDEDEDD
jgi:polysaccharide pyruvyl transferase WcaK-like protein